MALRTPAVTWSLPPMHASPLRCTLSRQRGSLLGGGGSRAQESGILQGPLIDGGK